MNDKRIDRLLLIAEMAKDESLTLCLVEYATIEVCEAGADALREQAEREKGCEWCHRFINKELQLSNVAWVKVSFCPHCGKRLAGEKS